MRPKRGSQLRLHVSDLTSPTFTSPRAASDRRRSVARRATQKQRSRFSGKRSGARIESGIGPEKSILPGTRQALGWGVSGGAISRAVRAAPGGKRNPRPGTDRGFVSPPAAGLEPIQNLVSPETFEPMQRLVERRE